MNNNMAVSEDRLSAFLAKMGSEDGEVSQHKPATRPSDLQTGGRVGVGSRVEGVRTWMFSLSRGESVS